MPELLLIVAAILAVGFIWFLVKDAYEKRRGTGAWQKYGPNPTAERIAEVDRPRNLYLNGVTEMLQKDSKAAEEKWAESARLGEPRAVTGLGIIAWEDGRKRDAKEHWSRAAARGEVPAQILLSLGKKSGTGVTRSEFMPHLLRAEHEGVYRDLESLQVVTGAAATFGYHDYADKMAALARKKDPRAFPY